jgi:L,D-peptidoglycan transpeptidase YkuD (ErfK/YbiS/YcfS/YnhG family)
MVAMRVDRCRAAMLATVVAALAAGAAVVRAEPPALLQSARQLILVVTPDWNAVRGELRRFERDGTGEPGRSVGAPGTIVVGKSGTAWDPLVTPAVPGPTKAEGDGRSPAGVFSLGRAFGYAPSSDAAWLRLPYLPVVEGIECVDDPASTVYNQIVDRRTIQNPDWTSAERMREVGEPYRWGVVVNYNTPAVPRRGSCIFLHIGGEGGRGTAGCTAMAPEFLREVMAWIDPERSPVLVQLPEGARSALKGPWALP